MLIPSLRITDSRTHPLWSRDHVLSRFTLSVSFPSFGKNNARWRLCCSCFPAGFSRDATAGDSAGDLEKLTCAGPSSLGESLLALSRLGFWLLFAVVFIAFIYLLFAFMFALMFAFIHIHCLSGWLVVCFSLLGWELLEVKGPIPRP